MSCCMECEYMNKFSGLFHCQYKTPAMKRMEAAKKKEQEFIEENRRASKLIREQMREEAKKRAIKRAKANKRKRK